MHRDVAVVPGYFDPVSLRPLLTAPIPRIVGLTAFFPFKSDISPIFSLFKGKNHYLCKKAISMIDLTLHNYMREELLSTPVDFERYLMHEIPWEDRMIGILGPRGVGKSTLVKQHILAQGDRKDEYLYVSADHTYLADHTLAELADRFVMEGGRHLVIDEIHKYAGWSRELKQIYDIHSGLQVIFTGSSVLDISKGVADLSRRALVFEMQGLSFREYLELFKSVKVPAASLDEIIGNKVTLPDTVRPLPLFREYLASGYYPFSSQPRFDIRIQQVVAQTLEVDIPQYANMTPATSRKLKRLLAIISGLSPFKPNMLNLSVELKVSKNDIPDYLYYLEKAGMIGQLRDDTGGLRGLGKLEKVYLDNPSLMTVLAGGNPDIGNLRETFFYNQTRVRNDVTSSRISDFQIGAYTFEVGGHGKGKRQLDKAANGIVVRDDIEYGHGEFVPLWAFGMNY